MTSPVIRSFHVHTPACASTATCVHLPHCIAAACRATSGTIQLSCRIGDRRHAHTTVYHSHPGQLVWPYRCHCALPGICDRLALPDAEPALHRCSAGPCRHQSQGKLAWHACETASSHAELENIAALTHWQLERHKFSAQPWCRTVSDIMRCAFPY